MNWKVELARLRSTLLDVHRGSPTTMSPTSGDLMDMDLPAESGASSMPAQSSSLGSDAGSPAGDGDAAGMAARVRVARFLRSQQLAAVAAASAELEKAPPPRCCVL